METEAKREVRRTYASFLFNSWFKVQVSRESKSMPNDGERDPKHKTSCCIITFVFQSQWVRIKAMTF
jgi:hypothetical protein